MDLIKKYSEEFSAYLTQNYTISDPVNLYQPAHYILQLGGKRLRPVLALLGCSVFNENFKKALPAAMAVEVFHNFTLVHDDIMDNASIRRGKHTVHIKWDVNTGILSGDAMLIQAYQFFEGYSDSTFKKLMQLFNKTALEVCEGQQLDKDFETRNDVQITEYLKMITFKTAVLVAAALKMGAIIANAAEEDAAKLYDFGLNLGIAFQLQDDYLDTFGNQNEFGKKIGGDIVENKKTFLFLKALEDCSDDEKNELEILYSNNHIIEAKVERVTHIFKKNNIDKITSIEIEKYTQQSLQILESLKIEEYPKQILKDFALNLMNRKL